ncbi:MAG: hypothetical protein WDZ62_01345 [Candidatus Pacearchaeota archaeon]
MSILNFLKKLTGKKAPELEPENEKIELSELEAWLDLKEQEIKEEESKIFSAISKQSKIFESEIEKKIEILKNFNVDSKKEADKLKAHSKEGREKYMGFVKEFVSDIKNLKESDLKRLENFALEFNKILTGFSKKGQKSYARATILIGKEARQTRETIQKFTSDISNLLENNKDLLKKSKTIYETKEYISKLSEIDEKIKSNEKDLKLLEEEEKKVKKQVKKIQEETEKVDNSEEHNIYLKKQEKTKHLKNKVEEEIFSLRQLIDFKSLGNFYHKFPNKMEIVKSYRENFRNYFNEDKGKKVLELMKEAKMPYEKFEKNLGEVSERILEISKLEEEIREDKSRKKLSELNSKLTSTLMSSGSINNKKKIHEQKIEKLKTYKEKILEKIKENVKDIGAELIIS